MTHALTVALTLQSPSDMGNGARYIPLDFQRFSFISSFWSKSLSRFHIPRGIRHEMPTSSPQDILAAIRTQRTSALSNLSSILDIISRRHISIFGHISPYCRTASRPTRSISCSCQLVSLSTHRVAQTPLGDADLDDVAGGSTRSEGTPARLLPITGDRHKGEAIDVEKGRYGHD